MGIFKKWIQNFFEFLETLVREFLKKNEFGTLQIFGNFEDFGNAKLGIWKIGNVENDISNHDLFII